MLLFTYAMQRRGERRKIRRFDECTKERHD